MAARRPAVSAPQKELFSSRAIVAPMPCSSTAYAKMKPPAATSAPTYSASSADDRSVSASSRRHRAPPRFDDAPFDLARSSALGCGPRVQSSGAANAAIVTAITKNDGPKSPAGESAVAVAASAASIAIGAKKAPRPNMKCIACRYGS